jgi:hypothetical protein
MNRALWILALVVDALGVCGGLSFFATEVSLSVMAWGAAIVLLFGALVLSLFRPQVIGGRRGTAALCIAVPGVVLVGSLDHGMISGQESIVIVVAALIGWLNWVALNAVA